MNHHNFLSYLPFRASIYKALTVVAKQNTTRNCVGAANWYQYSPSLTYSHSHKYTYYITSTHLEIWLTGWSHLDSRVWTLTAATYTFTSPVADTLVQIKTQSVTNGHVRWHYNLICKQQWLALLTPLLSRQVWLLLGHSQALPIQPSVHAHLPIMQEPRSDR